ncbi:hypothetical protein AVEN_175735-1 [Araneus ventricosus]|uniref:Uncharacterized protein n=1 Tax=Araneus ventricosus TaxID=182803 RepID=A0A4Y2FJ35_ARAVE|nr:hypothetical protein AVEN_175735-1 [Araneus ventricosus]
MTSGHDSIKHCDPRMKASITKGSYGDNTFYRGTALQRRRALRATPPLIYPPGKREHAYLYGGFSSVNSRCLPVGSYNVVTSLFLNAKVAPKSSFQADNSPLQLF